MNRTRKLGIAATLAGVITLGCGLAMTPRALAAPHGYDPGPRHAAFHDARYAAWDHRGARDYRGGWDHRGFGYGRDYRGFGRDRGFGHRGYGRDHRDHGHGYSRRGRSRHYWM